MGKIGKCCCVEGECCICDEAWEFGNWSVTLLGKTFSGTFSPADKPSPFTVENGCSSRQSGDCIVDNPVVLLDCIEESAWSPSYPVGMSSGVPFTNLNNCYVACPQCICYEFESTTQDDEACLREGLVNWEYQDKGVTHSRIWQQEAYYGVAQMLCCDSPANSVKFIFDLYYHVARFAAQSSQAFRRFRSITYDCIYDPGESVTAADNVVYGSWVQPVAIVDKPPCLPCDWTQSDFFANCATLTSPCPECPDPFGCANETVTYEMEWIAITCDFLILSDDDADLICPIPDDDGAGYNFVYYGSTTLNAYSGSNTAYCEDALSGFGNCTISPLTAVIEHRFMSDCIPCDELTCSVTLDRTTGGSLGSPLEECMFNEDLDCSCGVIPELCKTIPASITISLTPCP